MTNTFIIHGIYGVPDQNWFPWLKKELEDLGIETHVPHLPTREPLTPADWWDAFAEYESEVTEDSILIGHSLGCAFSLNILERHPVRSAFFVGPAVGPTDNEFTETMKAVSNQEFDWDTIKRNCKHFVIIHSDNDPYIPLRNAEALRDHLDAEFLLIPNSGHFNDASGHTELPELLEAIQSSL